MHKKAEEARPMIRTRSRSSMLSLWVMGGMVQGVAGPENLWRQWQTPEYHRESQDIKRTWANHWFRLNNSSPPLPCETSTKSTKVCPRNELQRAHYP
ncbi:hypothetical protein LY78DRAFT_652157, partial [Colletotrichum sublineola]